MTVTVKNKSQLLVPPSLQRQAGFKMGDQLEVKAIRGVITIALKLEVIADESSAERRRQIDAQLADGLADFSAGRAHGPFTAPQAAKFLRSELKARSKKKSSK